MFLHSRYGLLARCASGAETRGDADPPPGGLPASPGKGQPRSPPGLAQARAADSAPAATGDRLTASRNMLPMMSAAAGRARLVFRARGAGAPFADRPKARARSPGRPLTAQFEQKPHTVRVWFSECDSLPKREVFGKSHNHQARSARRLVIEAVYQL